MTDGLREALLFLNRVAEINPEIDPNTTPWFVATNALIQEISFREGVTINDVVTSLHT